jgi:hypothetical protein
MALIKASQISGSVASAIYAVTASYALNGGSGGVASPSFWLVNGSTLYTSQSYSVQVTGSLTVAGTGSDIFLVKNSSTLEEYFKVTSNGITQFFVHTSEPTLSADYGQVYFTTNSLYLGL